MTALSTNGTGSGVPILLCYDGSPSSATAIAVGGRLLACSEALVCRAWSGRDGAQP